MADDTATSTATGTTKKNGFISFLDAVGADFKKAFSFIAPIATAATPIVSLVGLATGNPALGTAYAAIDSTIQNVVVLTEQKFAAMGQQSGTGPQKLAEAVSIVTPAMTQILGSLGVQTNSTLVTAWVNAVVALLNAYPAVPATTTATITSTAAATTTTIAA